MKRIFIIVTIVTMIFALSACQDKDQTTSDEVSVVTTLFPQYDMVRSLSGDSVELSLTLPAGVSAHTYEPTPQTVIDILNADLFIYSSDMLEPWVEDVLSSNDTGDLVIIDLSDYVILLESAVDDEDHEDEHSYDIDPHYWSDPLNAKLMVNAIAVALENLMPTKSESITENKNIYLGELDELHEAFLHLEEERTLDTIMHGGHNAIGYFVERYHLIYMNPYEGFSTDSEPTAARITEMIDVMEANNIEYLFSEKLLSQAVSHTIQEQTGAEILYIYSLGGVSKEDFDNGITFIDMMTHNLEQYEIGLGYDDATHTH